MIEISYILMALCLITVIVDLALILQWFSSTRKTYDNKLDLLPHISILLAARNEEHNLGRCVESLIKLDYPKEKLEILIGDDASEDNTLQTARALAVEHKHITVHSIKGNVGNARGKANVLAHLARAAKGDIYFITDADIAVPPTWIRGMLRKYAPGTGIVTGVTAVDDNYFQHIDWTFALGMVKVITDLGQPVTAMGNNMYITREAYEAVGGYESIPFSVTEDFELFKQVRRKGFNVVQLYDQEVQAFSRSMQGIRTLLNQRKRWMTGAIQLPWPIVSLLIGQAFYYPAIIFLFLFDFKAGVILFLIKLLVQTTFIVQLQKKLRQKINLKMLLLYEVYSCCLSLASAVYFLIPGKIIWKGRKY